jgi:hypothetical protein
VLIRRPTISPDEGQSSQSQNGSASVLQCNSPDEGQSERSSQSKWVRFFFCNALTFYLFIRQLEFGCWLLILREPCAEHMMNQSMQVLGFYFE